MKTITLEQAVSMIPDGASLMVGGFMAVGTPERLVDEIVRQGSGARPRLAAQPRRFQQRPDIAAFVGKRPVTPREIAATAGAW